MSALPEFRSHGFDTKFEELTLTNGKLANHTILFVDTIIDWFGDLRGRKVLDIGCGRGELVRYLRERGARAFGVEIDSRFVESGRLLESQFSDDYPILSIVDGNGKSIFPDHYFDLVISDQVIEHIADLDNVASEISRILKRGGKMLHQYPAHRIIREPHYQMPLVHWLPKNNIRFMAIKFLLLIGFSSQFFPNYELHERSLIIYKYSVEETFYRSPRLVSKYFEKQGIVMAGQEPLKSLISRRLGITSSILARLVGTFRNVLIGGSKPI